MNRLRADLVLLLVAFIWGSAFAVQKVAAQYFDIFTFNGLRFLLGGLVLLPFSQLNPLNRARRTQRATNIDAASLVSSPVLDRKSLIFILLAGILLFGAAGLQQAGLASTTAGNAGFITTLYVVLVPIVLVIFWKVRIPWISWFGAGIAIVGSLLLSTGGTFHLAVGDALEMAAAVLWTFHMILVSRAVKHMEVLTFAVGQSLVTGMINILVGQSLHMSWDGLAVGWWTILYLGLLSVAAGYTLQVFGQKYAPPTDATILLSMEAVFAALIGYIFLDEKMKLVQLVGCGLILLAVIVTQLNATRVKGSI